MRYDKVCEHSHYFICKASGIEMTDKWYTHMPKPVYEEGDVSVVESSSTHRQRTYSKWDGYNN